MRSDEYAARRLRHATEVKRRPLIGIVAKRTLVTRDKKRRVAISRREMRDEWVYW